MFGRRQRRRGAGVAGPRRQGRSGPSEDRAWRRQDVRGSGRAILEDGMRHRLQFCFVWRALPTAPGRG
eukprot:889215-Lingulodinium_polyedra.AAC.1